MADPKDLNCSKTLALGLKAGDEASRTSERAVIKSCSDELWTAHAQGSSAQITNNGGEKQFELLFKETVEACWLVLY